LDSTDLVLAATQSSSEVKVPLLFKDISLCYDEMETPVISVTSYDVRGGTWLVVVEGDETDAKQVLSMMTSRGAVRYDFLADFRIEAGSMLGKGTFAKVHKVSICNTRASKRDLVAKVPRSNRCDDDGPGLPQGVRQEVRMLLKVQGHPNVLGFRGIFCAKSSFSGKGLADAPATPRWAIIMDYHSGGDLWHTVSNKHLSEHDSASIVRGILLALQHIHALDIVHRDVKPENILLTADRQPVLVDFGTAAELTDESALSVCCGSLGYMAPEVITNCLQTDQAEKVDLFSVGSLIYFLLSGRTPFSGKGVQQLVRDTLQCDVSFDVHQVFQNVSEACKSLIRLLLQKTPNIRPNATRALQLLTFAEKQAEIGVNMAAARTAQMPATEAPTTEVVEGTASSSRANLAAQHLPTAAVAAAAAEAAADSVAVARAPSPGSDVQMANAPQNKAHRHGLRKRMFASASGRLPTRRTRVQQFAAPVEPLDMVVNHGKTNRKAKGLLPEETIDPMTMLGIVPM
jgi:hypothetical protein